MSQRFCLGPGSVVLACLVLAAAARADDAALEKQRCPRPAEFASVFSFGYAGDAMPKDDDRFEQLLQKVKAGGFNVIHCTYTDKRLELCKKHGVKMMIDLLAEAEHHVYKSADKAKAVCEKLKENPDVWGYNIWNDTFAKTGEGRRRDVNTVRTWDPTHPAFSGTYRAIGMSHLVNADVFGYYDFHWKRGRDQHFPHLLQYAAWARERNALFYRWAEVDAGLAGKGNANRCQYTVTTSAACGLKGVLWFLGTALVNKDTLEWTAHGEDIVKVNREVMPLSKELARIGNPSAIYSTPITKTANNEPLPDGKKEMMPLGLENNKVPAAFAVQPAGGEFVLGVFQDPEGRQALFVANHNAYEGQDIELKLTAEGKVSLFDRLKGQWTSLEVKEKSVRFRLAGASGELLRLEK